MIKILIDASIVSKGGGVQVALSLIENIAADSDFKATCVVNSEIDNQLSTLTKQSFDKYYIEKIEPIYKKFSQGKRISKIEKEINPDFVFVVFGPAYWKPKSKTLQGFALGKMLYQKELKIGIFEKCINFLKKLIFKWSNSFLVVETELVKEKLENYLKYNTDIYVIGNSYSPAFYQCVMDNKATILPSDDYFQLLVPGSYYPHKNLEKIIYSLVHLKERLKKHSQQFKLLFTIPKSSENWKALYQIAIKYEVENFIETIGFIDNSKFAELYLKSNAVICASLVESSTAVFPESFLAMKPLLVSDRPFAHELCENAALYFDPLNEVSIADVIWSLIIDESLQDVLVKNGQKVLLKNYPSAKQKWALQKKLIIELANK
ncbi:glycosyltransferase [Acinetobacter lwoffii]|uniref:glycosyltransferase n=1 Tax=Acinetobacter lwoffii TaxID=28090 RepID=UPI00209AC46B|nr:glycosyltransferase [Acinetobacter lwoffii]MCO8079149.1 glycosyltransferase [Acinetobacter lwoffii]